MNQSFSVAKQGLHYSAASPVLLVILPETLTPLANSAVDIKHPLRNPLFQALEVTFAPETGLSLLWGEGISRSLTDKGTELRTDQIN